MQFHKLSYIINSPSIRNPPAIGEIMVFSFNMLRNKNGSEYVNNGMFRDLTDNQGCNETTKCNKGISNDELDSFALSPLSQAHDCSKYGFVFIPSTTRGYLNPNHINSMNVCVSPHPQLRHRLKRPFFWGEGGEEYFVIYSHFSRRVIAISRSHILSRVHIR